MVKYTDDLLVTAAVLGGDSKAVPGAPHERLVYQVRDASGRVHLRSQNAPPELLAVPLQSGFADVADWRVVTVSDPENRHFVQLADPLAERREALATALLWLTVPLARVAGVRRVHRVPGVAVARAAGAAYRRRGVAAGSTGAGVAAAG